MSVRTLREIRRHLLIYSGLAPFVVIALFPVVWMAITAFKEEADLYRMDLVPFWFHLPPTLKNFEILFSTTYFGTGVVNTALLGAGVVVITLVTAAPASYALARLRLPGAQNLGITIFMTYLVPPIVLFLPLARVVGTLGLFDSWWALVLVYPTFTIPFCTWLLMGFFKTIPRDLEEAAWVDGCGVVGRADGGRAPGRAACRNPLHALHRPLHPRPHRRRGQPSIHAAPEKPPLTVLRIWPYFKPLERRSLTL